MVIFTTCNFLCWSGITAATGGDSNSQPKFLIIILPFSKKRIDFFPKNSGNFY